MGNTTSSEYRPIDTMEDELTPIVAVVNSEQKKNPQLKWIKFEELSGQDFPRAGELVRLSPKALQYSSTLRTFYELAVPKKLMLLTEKSPERYCFVPDTMSYDEFCIVHNASPGTWYVVIPKKSLKMFERCINDEVAKGIKEDNDNLYKTSKWPLMEQLINDIIPQKDDQLDSDIVKQKDETAQ